MFNIYQSSKVFYSDETNGLKFYLTVCDYTLYFVNSQAPLALEALLKTLFTFAFTNDEWKSMFCSTKNDRAAIEPSEIMEDSKMLLVKNRSASSRLAAATLVHSGIIGKGARKTLDSSGIVVNDDYLFEKFDRSTAVYYDLGNKFIKKTYLCSIS